MHIHHAHVGLAMIWVGVTARLFMPIIHLQGYFDALMVSGFGVLGHDIWIEIRKALQRTPEQPKPRKQ